MRAPISIVIPTLDAAESLPATLSALVEGLEAGIVRELIVSDGGSQDATCAIAGAAGAELVTGAQGRGPQLARGVAAASGPWVLILHADTTPADGWSQAVGAFIRVPGRAGYFDLAFRTTGLASRIVAGWANLRSRLFGLPYGDQGLLVPRVLLDRVGGIPELPLMEDVELARRLKGKLHPLGAIATTSAARYQSDGWLRRSLGNGLLLLRYLGGADPVRLAKSYSARD